MIDVFISHSSQDEKLAEALGNFLREALSLKPERIRCTSVPLYGLRGGARTESQLRAEIVEAKCFLALITPTSVRAPWVLIEIGARWATNKQLTPLLAKGALASSLKGPITLLNALRCNEAEMHKLVHEMAKDFGDDAPLPAVYRRTLIPLLNLARPSSTSPSTPASFSSPIAPPSDGSAAWALLNPLGKRGLGQ
jgi:hypothetical protein